MILKDCDDSVSVISFWDIKSYKIQFNMHLYWTES